jgi:hypothetical protein
MISSSQALKDVFYNNTAIEISSGCVIEYNMNTMLDNISAVNNISDATYVANITNPVSGLASWPKTRPNPYKKLFPVDSIIKPFRPINPGIKYYITNTVDTPKNSFSAYRTILYPSTQPRIYYPGVETYYKYWVTPENTGANITVNYVTSGTQYALTNKIVLNFEKNHSLPSTFTIKIVNSSNTESTIANALSVPSDGKVSLYYNGTSWSTTEPSAYADPISIKSVNLTTPSAGTNKIIGVIELSARWIKDISSDVESFEINKTASATSEDILPVGKVTSNTLSMQLNKFNQSTIQYVSYNRTSTLNNSLNYMVKNAEVTPYFKIYHTSGALTESDRKYDRVAQGIFYIDSWDISSYGEVSLIALDSAKYLMETISPDILCESYPVTAILRRLLDSVGYTNYNFNLTSGTDKSIPYITYFWTDGTKTVWEYIQEICRDIQMNAIVDENNILQFYSREYMYNNTNKLWNFYESKENSVLPNIIDFSQKEIASANQVKVLWSVPVSSSLIGASSPLWQSQPNYLVAGGLSESLTTSSNKVLLDLKTLDAYSKFQSGFNFNGYFLIDSEIVEFDAIGYQYMPKDTSPSSIYDVIKESNVTNNGNTFINVWIEDGSDVNKYRNFSKAGTTEDNKDVYFKPNGWYRIKTRGALGTTAAAHNKTGAQSSEYAWMTPPNNQMAYLMGVKFGLPNVMQTSKSYMTLSCPPSQYAQKINSIAYRSFPAIKVPTVKTPNANTGDSYNTEYFSVGTSIVMDNTIDNPLQIGGVGFFINNNGSEGYYIVIESTQSAVTLDRKTVRLLKIKDGKTKSLKEIGTSTETSLAGIYGGRTYNIDIKVRILNKTVTITAYINGYKLSFSDTTTGSVSAGTLDAIIQPSDRVGLLCGRGSVAFDYAYGYKLEDYQYADSDLKLNIYQGQFNNDLINTAFGDLIYNGNYDSDEFLSDNKRDTCVDEFGTVVREIYKADIKYDTRPSYPIKWSLGGNTLASIVGEKYSNFGAQIYVLNNASATIPLSNGLEASMYIYGNTLGSSGQLEYVSNELNDFVTKEPIIFQSMWLQNESDVKNLADWIKAKVVNKGKMVNASVFGNPLLSVGDIVSFKYALQGLAGTENFIITDIKHTYSQGLDTSITCRTL